MVLSRRMEGAQESHIEFRCALRIQLTEKRFAGTFLHLGAGPAVDSVSECTKGHPLSRRSERPGRLEFSGQERLGAPLWFCMVARRKVEYSRRLRRFLRHSQG